MWSGPRRYRAFNGGVQVREAVRRTAGKGGADDDSRVGGQAAVDGDKVWYGWVGRRVVVNRDKVWLDWSYHIPGMIFVEVRGG